ncbi:MAG: hypothetical protein ACKVJK_05110 [Methylophagaceae bacterium]|jgi:hypothetical protein|tara:strand:- start:7183 stop:7737 length:555 start_codon:yes stop_codon:yes gene_type:complete
MKRAIDYYTVLRAENENIINIALKVFCDLNNIHDPSVLKDKSRHRLHVDTRTLVWCFLRANTTMGTISLARLFNRDHTTFLHSQKSHLRNLEILKGDRYVNPEYARKWEEGLQNIATIVKKEGVDAGKLRYKLVIYADSPINFKNHIVVNVCDLQNLVEQDLQDWQNEILARELKVVIDRLAEI